MVAGYERGDRCQVPRVGVEGVWKERLDIGRNRAALRGNDPSASVAIAGVVQQVQILTTGSQVVTTGRVVGKREIIVNRVHVLIAVSRQVVIAIEQKALECDAWPVGRNAVGRLPVLRPACQALLVDPVGGVADSELVQRPITQDLCELTDDVGIVLGIAGRGRGVVVAAVTKRLEQH